MEETVEHRVDVVAAPYIRGTFIFLVVYLNPKPCLLRLFNRFHAGFLSRKRQIGRAHV